MAQDFTLTAQLRLQGPQNINQVLNQIRNQFGNIPLNVVVRADGLASAQKQLGGIQNAADGASKSITTFGTQAALAAKRFFAFSLATSGFLKLIGAIQSGVKDAIEFEREVFKISQVTGTAVRDLQDLTKEVTRLSTGLGVSSKELLNVAQVLAQAGLTAEDTKISLEALAKSGLSPTFDSIAETGEGVIAIMAQFGVKATGLEDKLSSLNSVAGKFAVESSDLITAVRRTGGAFQAAGGSLEELISLFTSVRSTTRESAESIATGFRTIFTRLQRIRTVNFLSNIGVELRDLEGQFVGPYEAIRRLSEALKDIPSTDPRFAQVIEELGGFRQISKVIPLIQKFSESQKALIVAQQGQGSLAKDADSAQESLANKLTKTREEFEALIRRLTQNDSFKALIDLTTKLASSLIKVADAATPLLPLIAALGAAKIARGFSGFTAGFKGGLGFNSGGLVPGSGNRDTVPANLTPGEFVLRKSAVNAIGIDRLHGLNKGGSVRKYAKGGSVKDLYTNPSDGGEEQDLDARLFQKFLDAEGGRKRPKAERVKVLSDARTFIDSNKSRYTDADLTKLLLHQDLKRFETERQIESVNLLAQKEKNALKDEIALSPGKFLPPASALEFGAVFLNPTGVNKIRETDPIKFKSNVKGYEDTPIDLQIKYHQASMTAEAAQSFQDRVQATLPAVMHELSATLAPSISAKVGNTLSPSTINKIPGLKSVSGFLFEGALMGLGAPYTGIDEELDDKRPFDFESGLGPLSSLLPSGFPKNRPVDAKLTSNESSIQSLNKKAKKHIAKEYPHLFQPFAKGGQANGTDTVPAVLTPGEFVFTKDAAERIGYGNLNRMNKAPQGFAKGGPVKLAGGSSGRGVQPISTGATQPEGIFNSLEAKAFIFASSIQVINGYLGKTSKELSFFLDSIANVSTQFTVFNSVIKQASNFNKVNVEKRVNKKVEKQLSNDLTNLDANKTRILSQRKANAESLQSAVLKRNSVNEQVNQVTTRELRRTLQRDPALRQIYNNADAGTRERVFDSVRQSTLENPRFSRLNLRQESAQEFLDKTKSGNAKFNKTSAIQIQKQEILLQKKQQKLLKIEQDKVSKIQARNEIAGNVIAGTGAAVSVIGSTLSQNAQDRISSGNFAGAEIQSGIGGGLSSGAAGAAAGAALGSVIPGLGTAAGGIIGGLVGFGIGFVNASKEAQKQIASVKFEKTFKNFATKLNNKTATIGDINSFSSQAQSRLLSTTGDDFKTTFASLENQALQFDQFFQDRVKALVGNGGNKKGEVFEKFASEIGPDALRLFAQITNSTSSEIEERFGKIIESADSLAKNNLKTIQAMTSFSSNINRLSNITKVFSDVLYKVSSIIDVTEGVFDPTGATVNDRASEVIGNPEKFLDSGIFRDARNSLNSVLSSSIGFSNANNLTGNMQNGNDVIAALPDILARSRTIGTTDDPIDTVLNNVDTSFAGLPDSIRTAIETSLRKTLGSEGKPENLITALEQDFNGLLGTITDSIKQSVGSDKLAQIYKDLVASSQQEISLRQKLTALDFERISILSTNIDLTEQFNDVLRQVNDSSVINNFGEGSRNDKKRLLLGLKPQDQIPATSQIGSDALQAFNNIQAELARGVNTDPKNLSSLQKTLIQNTKALELLSNTTEQLRPEMAKLELVTRKRGQAEGLADSLAGGGKGARQTLSGIAQVIALDGQFNAQGGQLNGPVNPQVATQVLTLLNQNKDLFNAAGINQDDKLSTAIRTQAVNQFAPILREAFPDPKQQATATKVLEQILDNLGRSETDKVIAKIEIQIKTAQEANKLLTELKDQQLKLNTIEADRAAVVRQVQPKLGIAQANLATIQRDRTQKILEQNALGSKKTAAQKVLELTGGSDIERVLKNKTKLEDVKKGFEGTNTLKSINFKRGAIPFSSVEDLFQGGQITESESFDLIKQLSQRASSDPKTQKKLQDKLEAGFVGKGLFKEGKGNKNVITRSLINVLEQSIQEIETEAIKNEKAGIEANQELNVKPEDVAKNFEEIQKNLKIVGESTYHELHTAFLTATASIKKFDDEIAKLNPEVKALQQQLDRVENLARNQRSVAIGTSDEVAPGVRMLPTLEPIQPIANNFGGGGIEDFDASVALSSRTEFGQAADIKEMVRNARRELSEPKQRNRGLKNLLPQTRVDVIGNARESERDRENRDLKAQKVYEESLAQNAAFNHPNDSLSFAEVHRQRMLKLEQDRQRRQELDDIDATIQPVPTLRPLPNHGQDASGFFNVSSKPTNPLDSIIKAETAAGLAGSEYKPPKTYSPNTSADIRKTFDNLVPDKVLSNFEGLTTALNNFPRTVEHNFTGTLNVLLNGAEAFAQMNPQIEQLVMDRITSSMNKMLKQNFKGRAGEFLQEGNKDEK
jgi:TP901 family phage tail tape measure protein